LQKKVGAKWSLGYNRITIKKNNIEKKRREEGKRETKRTSLEKHIDKKRDVKFIEAKKGKQTNKKNIKW
jgi:hypothetical protein